VYVVALRAERRRLARAARREQARAEEPVPDDTAGVLDGVWISGALNALTERQRLATVLRYYADLSVDDVAQVMGCAPGTVKATVHAALARLRIHLVEQEEVAGAN
jgi:RNA polymerase sigma factor (sigma-70 family)